MADQSTSKILPSWWVKQILPGGYAEFTDPWLVYSLDSSLILLFLSISVERFMISVISNTVKRLSGHSAELQLWPYVFRGKLISLITAFAWSRLEELKVRVTKTLWFFGILTFDGIPESFVRDEKINLDVDWEFVDAMLRRGTE